MTARSTLIPDLDLARRFIAQHPPPGELILCALTGSHIYGFSSPDSDLDLKGIHYAHTRELLGFGKPSETHDTTAMFEGVECDLTTHEIQKAFSLLLQGNGNMLERFESPIQLYETSTVSTLRQLSLGARSSRYIRHYAGFFKGMCREHERALRPLAKTLLYTYRVALTGAHLLRTGELECDVRELAPEYGFAEALELVAFKASQREKAAVPEHVDRRHRANWPKLDALLQDARARTPLPPEPQNVAECEAWLIEQRLADLN